MPYSFNPFTSNFDKIDTAPLGFGDVFHLSPLTDGFVVVGDGTDFIRVSLAQVDANGRLILPEGNLSGLIFGDGDTGIWERTDDNLRFVIAGVERMTLDSTFFRTATDGFSLKLTAGTETSPTYRFQADQNTGIWQSAPDFIDFSTAGIRAGFFDADQFLNLINALEATSGGTGHDVYVVGDLLYASAVDALSLLGIGDEGDVLTVASGVPVWSPPSGGGGGLTWVVETTTSRNAVADEGVFGNNAGTITITLPTGAAIGETFAFNQVGAGLLRIQSQSTNTIRLGNQVSIAAGYIESNAVGDSIELVADGNGVFRAVSAWGTWDVETA